MKIITTSPLDLLEADPKPPEQLKGVAKQTFADTQDFMELVQTYSDREVSMVHPDPTTWPIWCIPPVPPGLPRGL